MKNPNWLYLNSREGASYSAMKAKALRLGYPFTIKVKEYIAILRECRYGHCAVSDGIKLLLDTREPSLGFCVGNTIFVCERHLGAKNMEMRCANTRDIIDHKAIKNSKLNKTNQI